MSSTNQTTTYTNHSNGTRLVVHHNGPWAERGEVQSVTDWHLNRYPTHLDVKSVNELLAFWGPAATQH
jgi:hypothetical protein